MGNKFCICHESEKHGQTSVMCCNHCGLPDEEFWQPSPSGSEADEDWWKNGTGKSLAPSSTPQSVEGMQYTNKIANDVMAILKEHSTFVDGQVKGLIVHGAIEKITEYISQLVGDKEREYAELLEVKNNVVAQRNEYMTAFDKQTLELLQAQKEVEGLKEQLEEATDTISQLRKFAENREQ